jgi:hypothetical protein
LIVGRSADLLLIAQLRQIPIFSAISIALDLDAEIAYGAFAGAHIG